MRILLVNYRYFISGGPEKYMFNIKKMLEDNGHEVIPFSIHSNKNVETEYSKYFVEPIGSRDATYFEECKKTPKVIWQMLTRSIYSTEVEKAIKKEIKDVKPDLVFYHGDYYLEEEVKTMRGKGIASRKKSSI